MHKCTHCGNTTSQGTYTYKNTFVCDNCNFQVETFHVTEVKITQAGPKLVEPFSDVDEKIGRQKFIDFLYLLFDRKINPAAYRLMNSYRKKGLTWLGMIRAMEWFYLIKKNSTEKSNNNIGIIPHIYEDAQKFYNIQAHNNLNKANQWYATKNTKTNETIIPKIEKKKIKGIDMSEL